MNRDEFMRELEYLLQDIPEEEKSDAIQYYRDYFEEAGSENEKQVIEEFKSPERVAAIIRSDLAGSLEQGGEFTEQGYQDERFRGPNYQVTNHYDFPESANKPSGSSGDRKQDNGKTVKIILTVLALVIVSPVLLGIGGSIFGILAGLAGTLIGILVGAFAMTIGFLIGAAVLLVTSVVVMIGNPLDGLLVLGIGIVFLGIGLLCLALSVLVYGRLLPWIFREVTNGFSKLLHRRNSK